MQNDAACVNTDEVCTESALKEGDICEMSIVIIAPEPKQVKSSGQGTEKTMARKAMSITIDIDDASAKERRQIEEMEFYFLWFDLRKLPGYAQFLTCCGGVFFFYCIYGYYQELIFTVEGFKPFGWYLTLVQFALYTVFGLTEIQMRSDRKRRIPLKTYLMLALLTVGTMGLSNSSLGYLNYPTQVIFKCCKLIPVLIGGIIIQGKRYGTIDVTACICMSIGLIFFTLADSTVSPTFSLYGVLLISMALCADAIIGNVQEKTMKQYNACNAEMVKCFSCNIVFAFFYVIFECKECEGRSQAERTMLLFDKVFVVLYSYAIGFIYILVGQVVTAQLWQAFAFCVKNPVVYFYIFIFSLTGYIGVNVVLNLVKIYGALIAVTVTTCRKALTIVLSFLLFTKPFTFQYVWSGLIVLLGIYLNIYSKNKPQWDARMKDWFKRFCPQQHRLVALQNLQHIV